jgi:hypothetical protein
MRSEDGYVAPEERYSPECVEGRFCELRLETGFADVRYYSPMCSLSASKSFT